MFWITEQVAVSGAQISPDNCYEYFEKEGITAVVNLRLEYRGPNGTGYILTEPVYIAKVYNPN